MDGVPPKVMSRPWANAAAAVAAAMIFASPLVKGGTPRLGTIILQLLFVGLLLLAAAGRSSLEPSGPGAVELSLYAFLLLAAFNLVRVPYYHDAERCFLLIAMYVGVFAVVSRLPRAARRLPLHAVRATSLFQALLALGQGFLLGRYQPQGTFDNPNFLAGFLAAGAGLSLGALFGEGDAPPEGRRSPLVRWLPAAELAVVVPAVVVTGSRGGMLALGVIALLLLFRRLGRRAFLPLGLALLGLVLVPNPFRSRMMTLSSADIYAWSRLDMWRSALRMAADRPLLGVGLGQYQFFSTRYAFPVEGHWARYAKVADNPHSEPLMLAAEMGLAGALVLLFFLWAVGRGLRRGRRTGLAPWPVLVLAGVAAQAAVDFSLHSPPVVLASVALLAAWAPASGAGDGARFPAVRGRLVKVLILAACPVYALLAARPALGFYCFLKAGGGPVDLLDEKASLARWSEGGRMADFGYLERAIRWDGGSAPYHSVMGSLAVKAYGRTGEKRWLELAFLEIDTAAALNPNNGLYARHKADLLLSLYRRGKRPGGLAEAMSSLETAMISRPFDAPLAEAYARLALEAGLADRAAERFRAAAALEPCFLRARFGLGQALERLGRPREAMAAYRLTSAAARDCGRRVPRSDYETSLVDFDESLLHNRLRALAGEPGGAEGRALEP